MQHPAAARRTVAVVAGVALTTIGLFAPVSRAAPAQAAGGLPAIIRPELRHDAWAPLRTMPPKPAGRSGAQP
jgi:hypothetical protein